MVLPQPQVPASTSPGQGHSSREQGLAHIRAGAPSRVLVLLAVNQAGWAGLLMIMETAMAQPTLRPEPTEVILVAVEAIACQWDPVAGISQ